MGSLSSVSQSASQHPASTQPASQRDGAVAMLHPDVNQRQSNALPDHGHQYLKSPNAVIDSQCGGVYLSEVRHAAAMDSPPALQFQFYTQAQAEGKSLLGAQAPDAPLSPVANDWSDSILSRCTKNPMHVQVWPSSLGRLRWTAQDRRGLGADTPPVGGRTAEMHGPKITTATASTTEYVIYPSR